MHHKLKIRQPYLIRILDGEKTFEIRKNDRDYQVGDTLEFEPLEDEHRHIPEGHPPIPFFEITYIHMGYGMEPYFVALAIRQVRNA